MNEKTKKEGYTDQLNQELLGTLGEKASSEQISAAYEKREVHRDYPDVLFIPTFPPA